MKSVWVIIGAVALLAGSRQRFVVSTISADQLPAEFIAGRTFHASSDVSNPDSLLNRLLKAKLRVTRAWQPLDNICMGPIGPRFTVELATPDERILKFRFAAGDGRLRCATKLKRFVVAK